MKAARAFDLHVGGDVVDVVGGVIPVDVAEGVGLGVTGDVLGDGGSADEEVVDVLVRAVEVPDPVGGGVEAADGFVGVFQVEAVAAVAVGEAC